MSEGVQFDEDQMNFGRRPERPRSAQSKMADWLISKGIVKTNEAAQGVMWGIIAVNLIIIYVLIKYFVY